MLFYMPKPRLKSIINRVVPGTNLNPLLLKQPLVLYELDYLKIPFF
jgi:hypothetical protein